MNVNPAILRRVVSAKRVGERLQRHAKLNEVVEGYRPAMLPVELLYKEIDGGGLKAIPHHSQRSCQLVLVDETRVVPIVAAERLLPSRHVIP